MFKKSLNLIFDAFSFIRFILIIRIIVQVNALLETLEFQESARRKGHFALNNCLVLGHTKYNGVQRVYCNPFPAKNFPVGDTGTIPHRMSWRPETAGRVPGTDAGCGLSIRGLRAGPAICNEGRWG